MSRLAVFAFIAFTLLFFGVAQRKAVACSECQSQVCLSDHTVCNGCQVYGCDCGSPQDCIHYPDDCHFGYHYDACGCPQQVCDQWGCELNSGGSCGCNGVCSNGSCVNNDPCACTTCAPGQVCQNGNCYNVDPCAGVSCPGGQACSGGVCVPSCIGVDCQSNEKECKVVLNVPTCVFKTAVPCGPCDCPPGSEAKKGTIKCSLSCANSGSCICEGCIAVGGSCPPPGGCPGATLGSGGQTI